MRAELALRMLKSWFAFRKEWTLLHLKCLGLQILLWGVNLQIALLIAAKRLVQWLGGRGNG